MSEMHSGRKIRFLCDQNLGRLAKWLRILGYDTEFMPYWDDERVKKAFMSGRMLLTRKRCMALHSQLIIVTHDKVMEQIREVAACFDLVQGAMPFSRCNLCNAALMKVNREEVKGLVPEYVYATHEEFSRCPSCKRVYWKGTHFSRTQQVIDSLLGKGG